MKLSDWLYENSMTPRQLRLMLGVKDRSTVYRWLVNKRVPKPDMLQKIIALTKGAVTLEDFRDPTPPVHANVVSRKDGSTRWILPWTLDQHRPRAADQDADIPRLSNPILRAIEVLSGRAWFTPAGRFLLDGRVSDPKRIIAAANAVLREQGQLPIKYPSVEPIHD